MNALRAFDVAGRHLNFRAAAEAMGVTQGAVAQQVRLLEQDLGLALFLRLPKGLAFTQAGRGYHARIAEVFADLREATLILRPDPGKVLVSVTPSFAARWLIPNLPSFSAAHPDIDLEILATEKVSSFHGDGIDLAVRQTRPPFAANLRATLLFRQQIIAVASPQFVADKASPLSLQDLALMPKLHDAHDLWSAFLKRVGEQDLSGRGLRLSQTSLAIEAALANQGIALVSQFLVAREIATGLLVQVRPEVMPGEQDFYLLALRSHAPNPATESVVKWLLGLANPKG